MSLRCEICGNKISEVNINTMGGSRFKPKLYCSRDCYYIGEISTNCVFTFFFLILFPPFFPLFLYYWIKGVILRNRRNKEAESKKNLCFYCNKEIKELHEGKNVCMSCGNPIHFCDLCKKHIFVNEKTLQVEPCGHIFHRSELLDWSEENSVCPKCREKIELVDYEPE